MFESYESREIAARCKRVARELYEELDGITERSARQGCLYQDPLCAEFAWVAEVAEFLERRLFDRDRN